MKPELQRGCYCRLWQTQPQVLREQGLPAHFCGWCCRCQQAGHTRHHPGALPITDAWCDACYQRLARYYRIKKWGLIVVMLLYGLAWLLRLVNPS